MTAPLAEKVLLVAWQGADWRRIRSLIENDRLPNLAQLVRSGVSGPLAAPAPRISPALWTSAVTGKRAQRHRVLDWLEPSPDGAPGVRPVTSQARRTRALWNVLTYARLRSNVVGWPVTHPVEPIHGTMCSDRYALPWARREIWPLSGDAVHPPRVQRDLAAFRVRPDEFDAEHVLPFVPSAFAMSHGLPGLVTELTESLARDTSVHAAATRLVEKEPWALTAVHYQLIDRVSRTLLELACDTEAAIDLDQGLAALDEAYACQDAMLGRLLDLCGGGTTVAVVSDHGYDPGPIPNGAASARPHGFIALSGPRIRRGEPLHGADLLDLVPTILTIFGLPVGNDMDGRVLRQAFAGPVGLQSIHSWDLVSGDFGERGENAPYQNGDEQRAALGHLVRQGIVAAPDEHAERNLQAVERTRQHHLALSHLDAQETREALPVLEALVHAAPDDHDAALSLAQALHAAGDDERARALLEQTRGANGADEQPRASLLHASLLAALGEPEAALTLLERVRRAWPGLPRLQQQIATALLELDRLPEAEHAYRKALELDGESAEGYAGLAAVLLRQERWEDAATAALHATGLRPFFPEAHLHRGVALAMTGQRAEATHALETAVAQYPTLVDAHRWLSTLHDLGRGDPTRAALHRQQASRLASALQP